MPDALTITREWFELLEGLPTVQSRWNVLYAVAGFAFDGREPGKEDLTAIEKSIFMTMKGKLLRQKRNARFYTKRKNEASYSDVKSVLIRRLNKTEKASYSDAQDLFDLSSNQHSITNISPSCIDKSIQCSPTGENSTARRVFKVPTLEEVKAYCKEKNLPIDPEEFYAYYSANGWKVGRQPMKSFEMAAQYWSRRQYNSRKPPKRDYSGI